MIGGSVGLAAKESMPDAHVAGYDIAPGVLEAALKRGVVDEIADSVETAVRNAEVCFVACPVANLPEVARAALSAAPATCVVTDVGSIKRSVISFLSGSELERFVGGHPLAGAETSGVEHSRPDLFLGTTWYLTPTQATSGVLYERLYHILTGLGARCVAIDAETHDRLMATVSHLPHVLANVLVSQAARTLTEEEESLPATGPSFRDVTRVAGSNPGIWTDIFLANREVIAGEVEEHVRRLEAVVETLRKGDREAVDAWVRDARQHRQRLLEPQLDGGPVNELRVMVPNKPGIVAQVALALGRSGVNIVDIALHPAPDRQSGAITLWIAGDADTERASELITDLGHSVARITGEKPADA